MTGFWADFIDKKIYDLGRKIWTTKGEDQESDKKDFIDSFKLLEGELGDKSYYGGETLGYVDVALLPFHCWFYAYETIGNFNIEADCPKLIAYCKRCLQKESVSKSFEDPHKVSVFVVIMRKTLGLEQCAICCACAPYTLPFETPPEATHEATPSNEG
ncbi:PREDICTED: probable glutathione S-transferase [Populus euphratica]|uniref:Probable glutathione S-transferase n=1 Tax=Populus euphratica TaxID=75702 RepID=A0AAJ6TMP3_POPEU|nr:PREDICTED: probable glutathione S-transferase [Populus euphratica]